MGGRAVGATADGDRAAATAVGTTKAVWGLTMDPFVATRIACHGTDGVVQIWDARKLGSQPVWFACHAADGRRVTERSLTAQWQPSMRGGVDGNSCLRGQSRGAPCRMWHGIRGGRASLP